MSTNLPKIYAEDSSKSLHETVHREEIDEAMTYEEFEEEVKTLINAETEDARKKSEAMQYIPSSNFTNYKLGKLYDSSNGDAYTNLSGVMLPGKTAKDTMGISGQVNVKGQTVNFNVLWSMRSEEMDNAYGRTVAHFTYNDKLCFLALGFTLKNQKLTASAPQIFCVDGSTIEQTELSLNVLNIFYI